VEIKEYNNLKWKLITIANDLHLPISTNPHAILLEGKVQKFDFVAIKNASDEATTTEDEGEGEENDGEEEVEE
jgi:hypothetical protein